MLRTSRVRGSPNRRGRRSGVLCPLTSADLPVMHAPAVASYDPADGFAASLLAGVGAPSRTRPREIIAAMTRESPVTTASCGGVPLRPSPDAVTCRSCSRCCASMSPLISARWTGTMKAKSLNHVVVGAFR
jgi:hypothetical protein